MTRPTLGDEESFEHSSIKILNLPFDLAQGDELVEPFRASCFEFRVCLHGELDSSFPEEIVKVNYPQEFSLGTGDW